MSIQTVKITDKLSFREKYAVCRRLIVEVQKMAPSFIPFTVFRHFLGLTGSYLGIYVSAMVLKELEVGNPARGLIIKSVFLLGIACLLRLLNTWFEKKTEIIRRHSPDMMRGRRALKGMKLDYPDIDSPYIRELQERIENDNEWFSGMYGAFLYIEYLVYQIFNALFAIGLLVPVLSEVQKGGGRLFYLFLLVLVGMIVLNAWVENYYDKKSLILEQTRPEQPEDVNLTWEYARGAGVGQKNYKDIKLYGARALVYKYLVTQGKEFQDKLSNQLWKVMAKRYASGDVFGFGTRGVSYFFLTLIASGNGIPVGMVVQYVACFERLTSSIQAILRDANSFYMTARRQAAVFEYLDAEGSLYHGKLPVEKRSDCEYEVEFRNVSFRYPGSEEYALKDFSLKLRIGERMAVVGKNGSGKTTMIKLLCRLYDPTEGEILLNGVDIHKFDYQEYMKLFAIVFQDFTLFDFSVAKNVAAGEDYDSERVRDCLRCAGLEERLKGLERGIETPIGKEYDEDGILMSGGERQKLALARALYRTSPFILLDEPTAALDPVAEYEVYSAFNEMVGNKTAIYISHRLSSCRFCNDIVVFDRGRIAERGSHEELLGKTDGLYHSLWMAQAQYYERGE